MGKRTPAEGDVSPSAGWALVKGEQAGDYYVGRIMIYYGGKGIFAAEKPMHNKVGDFLGEKEDAMELNRQTAEQALDEALKSNPGDWGEHSRYVARASENIALHCKNLCSEQAYIYGLLHDIGRYAGVSSERHLIDGYRYCMARTWEKAAQICISHAFMIQDIKTSIGEFDVSEEDYLFMKQFVENAAYDNYDRLVQLCDALALPTGFCFLEKRFVDVTIRYGFHPATIDRWKKILEIKASFEGEMGCSIYTLLPGVVENSFRS